MSSANTMKTTAKPSKHDWSRFDAMTEKQRHDAAMSDPDAQPLTPDDFKRLRRTPRVKIIRYIGTGGRHWVHAFEVTHLAQIGPQTIVQLLHHLVGISL